MSNTLAIATVTSTLGQVLLSFGSSAGLSGIEVSHEPPDRARSGPNSGRQINLFLYEVTPNLGWTDNDLPIRNMGGTLINQPVLALDLHYLLTVYGEDNDEMDAQHLLAYAMSLFHDQAFLTRDQIRNAIAAHADISGSDLADQIELIKLCPHALTPDDIYKLWSAFQVQYRLSTAYDASVVLIERHQEPLEALPVRTPAIYTLPFRAPVINTLSPQAVAPDATLTIQGRNLRADVVEVHIGTNIVTVTPDNDSTITVDLGTAQSSTTSGGPLSPLIDALRPGITTIRVVHPLNIGLPPVPHPGFESNIVPVALVPLITSPAPITVAPGATLSLTVSPAVERSQHVALLLDDQTITIPARPITDPPTTTTLDFPIPSGLALGAYLARLRIDGVESLLSADPITGFYFAPTVTVT